jgi:cell division protein FtsQ
LDEFEYNRPNTRARIAARRKRTRVPADESGVLPGPRRAVGWWIATGKVAGLLLFAAGAFGLWHVSTSPQFTVREVRVAGTQALSEDEVRDMAAAGGESIWLVDTDQIVERLHQSAYVEQASARVELPDRLLVTVTERRPELRWQAGGVNFLVAADGRVLGADQTMALTNTLVIEDRSGRPLEPNDQVDAGALKLSQLIAVRLPEELDISPTGIVWDVPTGVFITTADGRTIVFGEADEFDRKLALLGMLLRDNTSFSYLDLRPATPFYRSDGSAKPEQETTP